MLIFYILTGVILLIALIAVILAYCIYKMVFYGVPNPEPDLYRLPKHEQYEQNKEWVTGMIRELDAQPYEAIEILSHDGLKLYGRYYHRADNAPIFIHHHGYKSFGLRDFCGPDRIVQSLGCNTLIIDHRAHGKSEGRRITFGARESLDSLSWVNYLSARFGKDTPIFLTGVSMGGATVLMATARELPDNVRGVIADCPCSSTWGIVSKVGRDRGFPDRYAYGLTCLAARFAGFDLAKASAIEAVKASKIPILLIHGEGDRYVPFEMSLEILESNPDRITFVPIPDAGHVLSYIMHPDQYTEHFVSFVNKCLRK